MSLRETFAPFEMWVPISKVDQKQRIIAGYASVKGIDLQNELVTIPALKEAWTKFIANIDYAHVHVMHTNIPVGKVILEFTDSEGKLWKSGVDDVGLFIIVKIRDDIKKGKEVWQLINSDPPVLKGFSIGGEALAKVTVEKTDSNLSYDRIDKLELHEISVVDNPANQLAIFQILKNANLVTRDQVLRHTPNIVVAKGAIKLAGSLVEHGFGEGFGLATPYGSSPFSHEFSEAIRKEWLRQGRTDLISKCSTKVELNGKMEDLYDLVLVKSGTAPYDQDILSQEALKGMSFMPDEAAIAKMSIEQAKTKLMDLYSERRKMDKELYGELATAKTDSADIGLAPEPTKPVMSEQKRAELSAKLSLTNLEIWALEDGLRAKIRESVSKVQTELSNTAQEAAGGFTPPVAKDEPKEISKKGEPNVPEEIQKGDKDAQILALVQGFSKALTDLLTKKEEPKETKKAAEGAGTSGEIAGNGNTTAQEELSHGPDSTKKAEEAKCSGKKGAGADKEEQDGEQVEKKSAVDPAALSKMVEDEVTKRLEERGLSSVKKSLAPGADKNDPSLIKKSDPLGMSLLELNQIPIERIAKSYPGGN